MTTTIKYVVKMEGRNNIPVPTEIATDEQKLRRALSSVINGIADADIEYGKEKDGVIEIEVVKKAGTKGNDDSSQTRILNSLLRSKEGRNPAIQAYLELTSLNAGSLDPAHMLDIGAQVNRAMQMGEEQETQMGKSLHMLIQARPAPSSGFVVLGL